MIFTATEAIGFAYGVTWNTVRRNIFNWKHDGSADSLVRENNGEMQRADRAVRAPMAIGNLEAKVKSCVAIDRPTIDAIKQRDEGKATKVINLIKSIQKTAEENSNDPFLIALAERAKAVQESFEDRQTSTEDALADLLEHIERNEQRKAEQAVKELDSLTYFVLCKLSDEGIPNAEQASKKVGEAFAKFPNWQRSEAELREIRKQVTFAVFAEEDDIAKVTATVEALFTLLQKSFRP